MAIGHHPRDETHLTFGEFDRMGQGLLYPVGGGYGFVQLRQLHQDGIAQGFLLKLQFAVHPLRHIPGNEDVAVVGRARWRFGGHGKFEMVPACRQIQRVTLAVRTAAGARFGNGLHANVCGVGRKNLMHGLAQERVRGHQQHVGAAGMHRQEAPCIVEFKQQIRQGLQRGLLFVQCFLQVFVGSLQQFDKQRAVQVEISGNFEDVPTEVVEVGHVGIEREHELAHGHEGCCRHEATHMADARTLQPGKQKNQR